jgi:hypothetical protein
MGGQACVFYGAAEFSRDCDIVILTDVENLKRLDAALIELQAKCIAVPLKDWELLDRGHAIHFRSLHPDAHGIRLDVMSKLRGCDEFELLWQRRTTIQDNAGFHFELIGIEDLVKAKKTQREKDWPMIRRLVDAHFDEFRDEPNTEQVRFWLSESRTPEILIALAATFPEILQQSLKTRPLLAEAANASEAALIDKLELEKRTEMELDSQYWHPLIKELHEMRTNRRRR